MKKHLLTLVLITLVSLTANAQTVYESLKGQPVHVVSGNGTIDHSLSATQTSVAAPMCKAEGEGGTKVPLEYLFVNGADVPFGADGFPEAPGSNAVFGRITADKLKPYADYSIVGIAFIVASDLGSVPSIIAMERRTDGYHTVAGGNIESYDVTNATNGIVLNEVGCTQTYVIPKEPKDILFGYGYTQSATGTNADKPIFLGKTTDTANGYLVLGTLNAAYGRGIYTVSSAKFPYAACVQLILSNGSTTEIVGVDGKRDVKVVERYTPDGQRVSAPVNGINIEKLSDGTTRKVFVKK
ncbi:hypothetical protein [Prevotella sp.]|uniref:hypothetical protein n=2 Tax=Prevotella TaxID=838 RepID=UPI00307C366B